MNGNAGLGRGLCSGRGISHSQTPAKMSQFKSIPEGTHMLTAASLTPLRPLWLPSDPHPARQAWVSQATDESQPRGLDSQRQEMSGRSLLRPSAWKAHQVSLPPGFLHERPGFPFVLDILCHLGAERQPASWGLSVFKWPKPSSRAHKVREQHCGATRSFPIVPAALGSVSLVSLSIWSRQ